MLVSRGSTLHRLLAVALGLCGLSRAPCAAATECAPTTGYSPCLDANTLWPAPGAGRFLAIASPEPVAAGRLAFAFQGQALVRPLVLEVPGPTSGAREVRLVDYSVDEALLFDWGLGHGVALGLALRVALLQRGAGVEGITSQRGAPLARTANRDPRVLLGWSHALGAGFAIEPRIELGLPFGDTEAFAGAGAVTAVPACALEARLARLRLGAELGLRLRRAIELATGRWGSQLAAATGASFDITSDASLFASAELFVLAPLGETTSARGRELGIETSWIPAEWLLSVGARPAIDPTFSIVLGGGSGLALSSDDIAGSRRSFFAPTTPLFRGVLALRYNPAQ
jgi:hypothetical protein